MIRVLRSVRLPRQKLDRTMATRQSEKPVVLTETPKAPTAIVIGSMMRDGLNGERGLHPMALLLSLACRSEAMSNHRRIVYTDGKRISGRRKERFGYKFSS